MRMKIQGELKVKVKMKMKVMATMKGKSHRMRRIIRRRKSRE